MAFNPLSSFRKYPKIWMSAVLLICMLTFVFERFFTNPPEWFMRRRTETYVKIHGTNFTNADFDEFKDRRNIANEFMRQTMDFGIRQLDKQVKSATAEQLKDPNIKQRIGLYVTCQRDLFNKLTHEQRYFFGGSKLNDLIDFIIWLQLADKYGVYLSDDDVRKLVNRDVNALAWDFNEYASRQVQNQVQRSNYRATDDVIMRALRDEYRVRIVQFALMAKHSDGPMVPSPKGFAAERDYYATEIGLYLHTPTLIRAVMTPEQLYSYYRNTRTELDFALFSVPVEKLAAEKVKLPENEAERLKVLQAFYKKYEKDRYNPSEDKPGFLFPAQVQVQYLAADANMPYYREPAQAVTALEKMPPVAFNPLMPLAGALSLLAREPCWETSLQRNYDFLQKDHKDKMEQYVGSLRALRNSGRIAELVALLEKGPPPFKYAASPWTTPYYWSPDQYAKALAKPQPANVAALLGAAARPEGPLAAIASYQAGAYDQQAQLVAPMVKADAKVRTQVGAELILSRLETLLPGATPFTAAALTYYTDTKPQYLPLVGFVEQDLRTAIEEKYAQDWVNAIMVNIKAELDTAKKRQKAVFEEKLKEVLAKYTRQGVSVVDVAVAGGAAAGAGPNTISAVKFGSTSKLRNEYDIDLDDNLKVLRDAFDKQRYFINLTEGRSGKPDMLKEGDFPKLFFGSDPTGVAPLELFEPNVWPPNVTPKKTVETMVTGAKPSALRLFDTAPEPIIYWKSDKKGSEVLRWQDKNPEFLKLVEKQYRMSEARNLMLNEVKRLTGELKKVQKIEGKDLLTEMRVLAKESGLQVMTLNNVAKLVENPYRTSAQEEVSTYEPYTLPRGRIPFPREDMVKDLLAMYQQTAPIKLGGLGGEDTKGLDDLNELLFLPKLSDKEKQVVKQIQVLTNKPRSVYYIVALAQVKEPPPFYFWDEILAKSSSMGKAQNRFIDQAQEDFGKEFVVELIRQLRSEANVEISDNAKKQMDQDASSGQQ
jgi:hypothetical protein